ncbi:MAG: UDP-2,3-diacylglucosamine diphosphatase [Deltaproteobacteria bacterium]|nr:UDP-2,3-diacylglucosamine diphosphatase [Deltaproteobacteria bacterium]
MKSIFLADAHLRDPDAQAYQDLLSFLQKLPEDLDNLFILGDFFDFWHGFETVVFRAYLPILAALEKLAGQGVKIHFFAGNHEISWGPYLENLACCYAQECIVELDGRKIYLAHGDRLNPDDRIYRLWSAFIRHPLSLRIINLLPSAWLWYLAGRLSHGSRTYNGTKKLIPAQVFQSCARILAGTTAAMVIGHFHQARQETFISSHGPRTLYLLGDWINERSYLVLENGQFSFRSFHQSVGETV